MIFTVVSIASFTTIHSGPCRCRSSGDECVVASGSINDLLIRGTSDAEIANVIGGVAERRQHGCEGRGHGLAEQEPHS